MDNIISGRWTGNVQLLYVHYPRYEEVTSRHRARNAQCMPYRCANSAWDFYEFFTGMQLS